MIISNYISWSGISVCRLEGFFEGKTFTLSWICHEECIFQIFFFLLQIMFFLKACPDNTNCWSKRISSSSVMTLLDYFQVVSNLNCWYPREQTEQQHKLLFCLSSWISVNHECFLEYTLVSTPTTYCNSYWGFSLMIFRFSDWQQLKYTSGLTSLHQQHSLENGTVTVFKGPLTSKPCIDKNCDGS